jgi:hypothetical protein
MYLDRFKIDVNYWSKDFSICTLVSNVEQYEAMFNSFVRAGFTENDTEYLIVDNTNENSLDGFSGFNHFLNRACGQFIIICHQDVLLDFDDRSVLERRLADLEEIDPQWAVVGNAGAANLGHKAVRISDPYAQDLRIGCFPEKVFSLDENFILVKNSANLAVSHDLSGFHLYGTDLCLIADILGRTSYVIDFHLKHLSSGTVDERFYSVRDRLVCKYQMALRPRFMQTMIDRFYLSGSRTLSRFFNHKRFLTLIKSICCKFSFYS